MTRSPHRPASHLQRVAPLQRTAAPSRRTEVRLALVVVSLLVASALLAAPGTATGLTKHQKDYLKVQLSLQDQQFSGELGLFETWRDTAQMNRDDLEDLINAHNPDDQAEIEAYETWGADFAKQVRKKVATDRADAVTAVNKLYAKAKPWFRTKADKRDLREGTDSLRGAFEALFDAYHHLGVAAQALSRDDFAEFDAEVGRALSAHDLAVSLFDGGLEKLRALL
jgi:hypothetical protein